MRNPNWIVLAIAVGVLAQGCASTSREPRLPVASMGAREVQTRFFEHVSAPTAMKAVIDMLQDGQFSIERTDAALGLVVGVRSTVQGPSAEEKALKWLTIGVTYGVGALLPWGKTEAVDVEANVNVTDIDHGARVRITLQRRVLDKNGRLRRIESLTDGLLYRDLFELLGRSLFVADQG